MSEAHIVNKELIQFVKKLQEQNIICACAAYHQTQKKAIRDFQVNYAMECLKYEAAARGKQPDQWKRQDLVRCAYELLHILGIRKSIVSKEPFPLDNMEST
jgi:hypothetical protein